MTHARLCWLLCSLTLVAGSAAAQTPGPGGLEPLAQGQELYARGYFAEAVAPLDRAARADGTSQDARCRALEMLGVSYVALGDHFEARRAFTRLLSLSPDHRLSDGLSPKVRTVFEEVRQQMLGLTGIGLRHDGVREARPGAPVTVDVEVLSGEPGGAALVLHLRPEGRDAFEPVPMAPAAGSNVHRAVLAPAQLGGAVVGARFEYFIEAAGSDGQVIGRLGGPRTPLVFELAEVREVEPALWGRPWFWVTVGSTAVLVAAASAGAAVWWLDQGTLDPCRGALDCVQAP